MNMHVHNVIKEGRRDEWLYSMCLQRDTGHATMGEQSFPILWVKKVMHLRLANEVLSNTAPFLKDLFEHQAKESYLGKFTYTGEDKAIFEDVRISRHQDFSGDPDGAIWMPDEEIANIWLNHSKTGSTGPANALEKK